MKSQLKLQSNAIINVRKIIFVLSMLKSKSTLWLEIYENYLPLWLWQVIKSCSLGNWFELQFVSEIEKDELLGLKM